MPIRRIILILMALAPLLGCKPRADRFAMPDVPEPSAPGAPRDDSSHQEALPPGVGDEIIIAGRRFRTGAPVVLWSDPGGFSAYSPSPAAEAGRTFGVRLVRDGHNPRPKQLNQTNQRLVEPPLMEGRFWFTALQQRIDQFVLHYDMCGYSARCFDILHNHRGLSVHFLLDIDGTIYQTLDVQERAWHATKANDRSVGIEIANIGAYQPDDAAPLEQWYANDSAGAYITVPDSIQGRYGPRGGVRYARQWPLRPARASPVTGQIHGRTLVQYDLTDAQYESLIRLTAALHGALPHIRLDYPRDGGVVLRRALTDAEFEGFSGVLGHWHVQQNKSDPGPALNWDRVIESARRINSQGK